MSWSINVQNAKDGQSDGLIALRAIIALIVERE